MFPAERGPPPSQRSSGLRAGRGHVGPHKGAAAGARGPRVKRRVRTHSARSREVARSEEGVRSEEEVLSEEEMLSEQVARNEQLVGSKEVARNEHVVGSKEVVRSEAVTESEEAAPTEEVAQNEEMAAAGLSVTVTHSEHGRPGGPRAGPEKSGRACVCGHGSSGSACPGVCSGVRKRGFVSAGPVFVRVLCQHTFFCGAAFCFRSFV